MKTIAGETTNDENLLKTLVCIERKTMEQIPKEYKGYTKHLSTRFGVGRLLRRQNNNPATIEKDNNHLTLQRTPGK